VFVRDFGLTGQENPAQGFARQRDALGQWTKNLSALKGRERFPLNEWFASNVMRRKCSNACRALSGRKFILHLQPRVSLRSTLGFILATRWVAWV
jgi:hypothetical protein